MSPPKIGRPKSSGAGSRMLPLFCPACNGIRLRAAFSSVARHSYPVCSCGTVYVFVDPAAHARYCDARGASDLELFRHPEIGECEARQDRKAVREAVKCGGKRHQCGGCSRFLRVPNELCPKCGYGNQWVRVGRAWRDEGRYGQGGIVVDDIPF